MAEDFNLPLKVIPPPPAPENIDFDAEQDDYDPSNITGDFSEFESESQDAGKDNVQIQGDWDLLGLNTPIDYSDNTSQSDNSQQNDFGNTSTSEPDAPKQDDSLNDPDNPQQGDSANVLKPDNPQQGDFDNTNDAASTSYGLIEGIASVFLESQLNEQNDVSDSSVLQAELNAIEQDTQVAIQSGADSSSLQSDAANTSESDPLQQELNDIEQNIQTAILSQTELLSLGVDYTNFASDLDNDTDKDSTQPQGDWSLLSLITTMGNSTVINQPDDAPNAFIDDEGKYPNITSFPTLFGIDLGNNITSEKLEAVFSGSTIFISNLIEKLDDFNIENTILITELNDLLTEAKENIERRNFDTNESNLKFINSFLDDAFLLASQANDQINEKTELEFQAIESVLDFLTKDLNDYQEELDKFRQQKPELFRVAFRIENGAALLYEINKAEDNLELNIINMRMALEKSKQDAKQEFSPYSVLGIEKVISETFLTDRVLVLDPDIKREWKKTETIYKILTNTIEITSGSGKSTEFENQLNALSKIPDTASSIGGLLGKLDPVMKIWTKYYITPNLKACTKKIKDINIQKAGFEAQLLSDNPNWADWENQPGKRPVFDFMSTIYKSDYYSEHEIPSKIVKHFHDNQQLFEAGTETKMPDPYAADQSKFKTWLANNKEVIWQMHYGSEPPPN